VFSRDQVVVVVFAKIDLDPRDLTVEGVARRAVVGGSRRTGVTADIGGFVGRITHWLGLLDTTTADRLAIVEERDVAAFGESATIVLEFHPDLMLAGLVALAELPRGIAVEFQNLGERCLLLRPDAVVAGRRGCHLGDRPHADGMVVTPGQQRGS